MLFFTIVVAPTVFRVLPVEWSSKYVRNFFPKYYASLGAITALCVFTATEPLSKILLAVCTAFFAFTFFISQKKLTRQKIPGILNSSIGFMALAL